MVFGKNSHFLSDVRLKQILILYRINVSRVMHKQDAGVTQPIVSHCQANMKSVVITLINQ